MSETDMQVPNQAPVEESNESEELKADASVPRVSESEDINSGKNIFLSQNVFSEHYHPTQGSNESEEFKANESVPKVSESGDINSGKNIFVTCYSFSKHCHFVIPLRPLIKHLFATRSDQV